MAQAMVSGASKPSMVMVLRYVPSGKARMAARSAVSVRSSMSAETRLHVGQVIFFQHFQQLARADLIADFLSVDIADDLVRPRGRWRG